MRSKLFVPGVRPDLFGKALASEADAISFDLEDSVPCEGKEAARAHVAEFLRTDAARASSKQLIVRINALGTAYGRDDLRALAGGATHLINVPKVEAPEDVQAAAAATDLPLLVNIESPRGLRNAAELAAAHPMVIGLQAGLNDLFESLAIDRFNRDHIHSALWQVRLAAGEAGCFAFDGAWPQIDDEPGYRAEAELAHSLGFLGKSCIHPRQVPIANSVFAESYTVEQATRILAAAEAAAERGHGAFTLEGRMIDRPAIDRAKARLATT